MCCVLKPRKLFDIRLRRNERMRYCVDTLPLLGWWRGTVVERRSLAGELSLSCARPAADG